MADCVPLSHFWKDFVVEQNLTCRKYDFWSYLNRLCEIVVFWDDQSTANMDPCNYLMLKSILLCYTLLVISPFPLTRYKEGKIYHKLLLTHFCCISYSSLSSVTPPNIWYPLMLPQEVIDYCYLSALQLEAIVYACQQHETFLADGSRAGFLIGNLYLCL